MRSILPSPDSTANQQSLMNGKSVLVAVSVIRRLRRYHEGLRPMQCKSEKRDIIPVSKRRCFNVYTTSIKLKRHRMDVKTTSYAYWDIIKFVRFKKVN